MTIRSAGFTIACDGAKIGRQCTRLLQFPAPTEARALELARLHRWERLQLDGANRDLCPSCAAAHQPGKAPLPALCIICGEPMPESEQMFRHHGFSGPCPKPPLAEREKQQDGGHG
jgi:hypothetical protein